jgi:hypothetical protein
VVGSDINCHPRLLFDIIAPNIVLVRGKRSTFEVKNLFTLKGKGRVKRIVQGKRSVVQGNRSVCIVVK